MAIRTIKRIRMQRLSVAFVALLAALAFAQSAAAATTITLGQVTPGGITTNPATAERIVEQQLEVNPNYRASIAQDIGATANQVEDALETTQARGIQRITLGEKTCLNTGVVVSTGMIRTIGNDHRTVIVMKFRISIEGKWKTFKIKVDCGNPCKAERQNHAPRAKVIMRTIKLPFSKKFSKKVTVCPDSNRPINITISGRIKGTVKAKLWAKLYGNATIKIKQSIDAEVELKVTAVCRDETPPAVCCAPVVIIIPPGPCCTPPPPPVVENPKPTPVCYGTKAHLQTNGDDYLFCEVVLPPGSTTITGEVIAKVSGPADAYVNGLIPVNYRWDNTPTNPSPCPSGTKCYRAHLWAGSTAGDLTVKFTVSAQFASGSPLTTTGFTEATVPIRQAVVSPP